MAEGRILLPRCNACGRHHFFPRVLCPHCHATDIAWVEASGRAVVYTCTTVRRRPEAGGDYNISMIELAEGVRMMSRVEGIPPAEVRIGMALTARVGAIDGAPAVLCTPAGR